MILLSISRWLRWVKRSGLVVGWWFGTAGAILAWIRSTGCSILMVSGGILMARNTLSSPR